MAKRPIASAVEPLAPVALGDGRVRYAPGMRAGPWVFATGQLAQDDARGIAPEVLGGRAPNARGPKRIREAARVFDNLEAVLAAGGSSLARVVRTDQYYTTVAMVPPYQEVRRARFGRLIPPSTSIVVGGLVLPGADLEVQAIAVADDGPAIEHIDDAGLRGRPTSGYSAALTAGDFVFVPGNTAMAQGEEPRRRAMAAAALIEDGMQWGGERIKLETEFIIAERILPSLALAGAGADSVLKAQAYLTDPGDYAAFNEAWCRHFAASPAALSVIPCAERGLAVEDGRLEINVLALRHGAGAVKEVIEAGTATALRGQPEAVRAGDLLFLSGLMAIDEDGLLARAMPDPRQPHFASAIESEAEAILDAAARICGAAGTSLANVVRVQQFHTDLAGFYAAHQAWQRALPGRPIPFSAVEVPGPLPVPGCTLMMDLWVYCP